MNKYILISLLYFLLPLVFVSAEPLRHEPTEGLLHRFDRRVEDVRQRIDTRDVRDQGVRPLGPKLEYYRCESECELQGYLDEMLDKEVEEYLLDSQ